MTRCSNKRSGRSARRFLTELRIEEAKLLLRTTDLALDRLAPRCGFASPGALSAAFVRHTGIRPSVGLPQFLTAIPQSGAWAGARLRS